MVPVVAFEAASTDVQREQFILVNRAKPLSKRLIDELLPETHSALLPRDLSARQLPSRLCNALNTNEGSPFRGMLRRASQASDPERVVTDSAVLNMIRRSLGNPNGALATLKSLNDEPNDGNAMLSLLEDFWSAVRQTFPDAWGRSPSESRLMHSVGIAAMGDLMDRITARASTQNGLKPFFCRELARIAKDCAWTSGRWPQVDRAWDSFQNTPTDIKLLSQVLVQLYAQRSRQ
jgi:DGQHR domain-containing protein